MEYVKSAGVNLPEPACRVEFLQEAKGVMIGESDMVVTGIRRLWTERYDGTRVAPIDQGICQAMYLAGHAVRLVRGQFLVEEGNPDNRYSRFVC